MWRKSCFELIENKKNYLLWLLRDNAFRTRCSLKVCGHIDSDRCTVCSRLINIVLSIAFGLLKFGIFLPLFFLVLRVFLLFLVFSLFFFLLSIFLILVYPFITIFLLQFFVFHKAIT